MGFVKITNFFSYFWFLLVYSNIRKALCIAPLLGSSFNLQPFCNLTYCLSTVLIDCTWIRTDGFLLRKRRNITYISLFFLRSYHKLILIRNSSISLSKIQITRTFQSTSAFCNSLFDEKIICLYKSSILFIFHLLCVSSNSISFGIFSGIIFSLNLLRTDRKWQIKRQEWNLMEVRSFAFCS